MTQRTLKQESGAVQKLSADAQELSGRKPRARGPVAPAESPEVRLLGLLDDYAAIMLQVEALEARVSVMKENIIQSFGTGTHVGFHYTLSVIAGIAPWKDEAFKQKIEQLIAKYIRPAWRKKHSGGTPYYRILIKAKLPERK